MFGFVVYYINHESAQLFVYFFINLRKKLEKMFPNTYYLINFQLIKYVYGPTRSKVDHFLFEIIINVIVRSVRFI